MILDIVVGSKKNRTYRKTCRAIADKYRKASKIGGRVRCPTRDCGGHLEHVTIKEDRILQCTGCGIRCPNI